MNNQLSMVNCQFSIVNGKGEEMNKILIVFGLMIVLILTACGGRETEPVAAEESSASSSAVQSGNSGRLREDYTDALPVQSQLAIGILQLENGDQAVDETMAAKLLPLWRAVQSLSSSETAAEAEITAVLNQIQDTLSADQVAAIATMQLTDESFQALLVEGIISMRGAFGGSGQGGSGMGDGSGRPAGGPSGDLPGGGGGPGGGLPGGDPSAQQTRIAERIAESGGDAADFLALAMTNAVVRLLESKTGEASTGDFARGGIFGEAITAVSESTGLSSEEVQVALGEGKTLANIIAENGGDLEAVEAALIDAANASDLLQDQDPAAFVSGLLTGENGRSGNE
jgi:hypothetical protein